MENCHSSQPKLLVRSKSHRPLTQPKSASLPKTPKVRKKRPPLQRFFECHICKCQLEDRACARKHMKQHVAARNAKCEFCRERFTSNELLEYHICGTSGMEFLQIACEYCDQSIQSLVKCVKHLETAHPDRTLYRCQKCPQCFGMMKLRDFHEKYFQHRKEGAFQCELCKNRFEHKSALRKHMTRYHSVRGTTLLT